jgi:hypothetical protein
MNYFRCEFYRPIAMLAFLTLKSPLEALSVKIYQNVTYRNSNTRRQRQIG